MAKERKPIRWDPKVGDYVPYEPDEYSEYKPGPSGVPTQLEKDHDTRIDSISQRDSIFPSDTELSDDEAYSEEPVGIDTRLSDKEAISDYQLTDAGEFLLNMSFTDLLQTYHMLKSFKEGVKLSSDQLVYLEETGFIEQ